MKKLEVQFQQAPGEGIPLGILVEEGRRVYFEYHDDFLKTEIPLSPFKLPLRSGLIEHTDRQIGELPGLFADSLPDGWGLLLMDRHFRREGIRLETLSPLDRLAYLGTRAMGALTYHPPAVPAVSSELIDLYELGQHAEAIFGGSEQKVLPQLMRVGGSPAGARPKALIGVKEDSLITGDVELPEGYDHWLTKFASKSDAPHAGPVEYAYSLMAREAGIIMPETRLFEVGKGKKKRRYFAVKRFDRGPGNRRYHIHTFANLVHVDFRIPTTDYEDLFKVTHALTRNHCDLLRLFRLMIFNVATHNRDDHAKNFSYLLDHEHKEWSLSPAYDLTFSAGPGGEHSNTILGQGREPTREHCLELAKRVGIEKRHALEAIDVVNAAIAQWKQFADDAACPKRHRDELARAMKQL